VHHIIECRKQHNMHGASLKTVMNFSYVRRNSNQVTGMVLGIKTSCDDTGCANVDNNGKLPREAVNSQQQIHLK
jgi:hypothetical protein